MATRKAFEDRDMVLVVALEGAGSTAGGRELTVEEAAAVRATLGIEAGSFALRLIGKDGAVKRSESKAVAMKDIYALIDSMPMRRAEAEKRAGR